jgi:hypothetical protein
MSTQEKQKKPIDEAVLRRLAEGRLKGLETRRKRAEIKKQEKADAMQQLNKNYEEKVLKSKSKPKEVIEETDKEIYEQNIEESNSEVESENDTPVIKANVQKTRKPKVVSQDAPTNYKQEYYRQKLSLLQQQQEQSSFLQSYERLPPKQHLADIAKNQIKKRVDDEVMQRVYKDLFQC